MEFIVKKKKKDNCRISCLNIPLQLLCIDRDKRESREKIIYKWFVSRIYQTNIQVWYNIKDYLQ